MKRMIWAALFAPAVVVYSTLLTAAEVKEDKPDLTAIFEGIITQTYQPRHDAFVESTSQLLQLSSQLCVEPSLDILRVVQDQFAQTVASFSAIELHRFGPLLKNNRLNRIFYWPDKRRVGERQLRGLLAEPDVMALNKAVLANKSVAVQGLPALERLLYAKDVERRLGSVSEAPDCHVALVIAGNLNNIALELQTAWFESGDIVQAIRQPSASSKYFRSEEEVLRNIATQISVGLDVLLERKIVPLLHADSLALRKAPFWKSEQTLPSLMANLQSIRALLVDSGLAEYTELANELNFEFRTAEGMIAKLQALPILTEETGELTSVALSLFKSLSASLTGLQLAVMDRFMASLGISAGFNSDDGD